MKITKKHIEKFYDKFEGIVEEIQELADSCTTKEGEADLAESLWIAQGHADEARQTLDGLF